MYLCDGLKTLHLGKGISGFFLFFVTFNQAASAQTPEISLFVPSDQVEIEEHDRFSSDIRIVASHTVESDLEVTFELGGTALYGADFDFPLTATIAKNTS